MNRIYKKLKKIAELSFDRAIDCLKYYLQSNRDFEYDSTNNNDIILSGPIYECGNKHEYGNKYIVEFDRNNRIEHVLSAITGEVFYIRSEGVLFNIQNELKPKLENLCSEWDEYISNIEWLMLSNKSEDKIKYFKNYIETNNDFQYYSYNYNIGNGGIVILDPNDEYKAKYLIKFNNNHRIMDIIDYDTGEVLVKSGEVEHYVPNELKLKLRKLCSEWNEYILNNIEEW